MINLYLIAVFSFFLTQITFGQDQNIGPLQIYKLFLEGTTDIAAAEYHSVSRFQFDENVLQKNESIHQQIVEGEILDFKKDPTIVNNLLTGESQEIESKIINSVSVTNYFIENTKFNVSNTDHGLSFATQAKVATGIRKNFWNCRKIEVSFKDYEYIVCNFRDEDLSLENGYDERDYFQTMRRKLTEKEIKNKVKAFKPLKSLRGTGNRRKCSTRQNVHTELKCLHGIGKSKSAR